MSTAPARECQPGCAEALRFTIKWLRGVYSVSVAGYDGGEVVDAASYDALQARVDELTKAQPIETAPMDTNVLLAWLYDGIWEIKSGWAGSTKGGYLHSQATHWMPLPGSPVVPLERSGGAT